MKKVIIGCTFLIIGFLWIISQRIIEYMSYLTPNLAAVNGDIISNAPNPVYLIGAFMTIVGIILCYLGCKTK